MLANKIVVRLGHSINALFSAIAKGAIKYFKLSHYQKEFSFICFRFNAAKKLRFLHSENEYECASIRLDKLITTKIQC